MPLGLMTRLLATMTSLVLCTCGSAAEYNAMYLYEVWPLFVSILSESLMIALAYSI